MAYDKAKWHFEAEGFPENVGIEQGGVHIAFFYRWMIENGFSGYDMLEETAEEVELVKAGKYSALKLLFEFCDGVLLEEDFNDSGASFATQYYNTKTAFSDAYSSYLEDYACLTLSHMNGLENTDYGILFIDDNYQKVKAIINQRYQEYLSFIQ
ncbi:DUF7832 domain-containing protein [Enterococcus sp. LJL128]